ncbi:MAG: NAD-dependent epimerase/dehydratase family protein [Chloroflexi bacterium]|nr:NAD-dependent epimerase/dehydratase family protein [Chloroflexota bacterium]
MNAFIVGGTGFLGYHAALEFLAHGWGVTVLGLPPAPPRDLFPAAVKVVVRDLNAAPDAELRTLLAGHAALVFAAGLDDRHTPRKPAYPKFHKANVEDLLRLMNLARQAGVGRLVALGSYFAHFNRLWPGMRLAERHVYIRSRVEQEQAAFSMPGLDGMALELPYIFGRLPLPGWRPLWTPLIRYLRSSKVLFYMHGGTACISARTVGRAVLAAVERGRAGTCYPIGQENLSWTQMLERLAAADGRRVRVKRLPTGLVRLALQGVALSHRLEGREGGLNLRHFAALQTTETFIDPVFSSQALGYELDDLDAAFRETVEACEGIG